MAARLGLCNGDHIIKVNGHRVFRVRDFPPALGGKPDWGRICDGIAALEEFQSHPPTNRYWNAAAGYLIGKWLDELGETERAKEALRTFLAANPKEDRFNDVSIRYARGLLKDLEKN